MSNAKRNDMFNEKGGIISKIFIIPAGVVLMAGFFLLGYYVGKYQNKSGAPGEIAPPLPEIASSAGQKQEEFTFYKTLTDKSDKTVSIDLKPKPVIEDLKPVKQQATVEAPKINPVSSVPKQPQTQAKREPAAASTSTKLRYTVQTGSYPEREMAEEEVKRLKKRGFAAFIVSSDLPGKGVWHRVRLGSFSNRAAAEKLQKAIHEKEKILTIVVLE
jgi:cell division septation protein DedD